MANQSLKKQKIRNEGDIAKLKKITAAVLIAFLLLRVGWFFDSFGFWHWIGLFFCVAIYWFVIAGLTDMTKCSYDTNGELIDAGVDLALGGLTEYYFDVIYITWFVQVTTIYSDWFWFAYLIVPAFALYKLYVLVIGPYLANVGKAEPVDERTKKRLEKKERQAGKTKFVKGR